MKGYWKEERRSRSVLIKNTDHKEMGYKTGDIVKQDAKGNLFFIGRSDETIKYSGYRIDLNEIEMAIRDIGSIKDVAIITLPDALVENIIIAFIIIASIHYELSEKDINIRLKEILPHYMIPQKIIFLESFPLNSSGKIDKTQMKLIAETIINNTH